jgi:hypothetical protein
VLSNGEGGRDNPSTDKRPVLLIALSGHCGGNTKQHVDINLVRRSQKSNV